MNRIFRIVCYLGVVFFMLPVFSWGQQANVNLDYNPQKDTEGLIPFSAPLNSPEVHDDRTVTFRLRAPEAKRVVLPSGAIHTALDLGREPIPFVKGEDGIWTLTIGPLIPDMYAYHFHVDGVQICDPGNTYAAFTAMPPYSQLAEGKAEPMIIAIPNNQVIHRNHQKHTELTFDINEKVDYLFVGQGTKEATGFFNQRVKALCDALNKHNIKHEYYEGGHWWPRLGNMASPSELPVPSEPLAGIITKRKI